MNASLRPLAIVTGASSGIGFGLARECARDGFDLLIAADRPLTEAVAELQAQGAQVEALEADLAQRYMTTLLKLILEDKLDTTFLISHRLPLEEAAHGYKIFKEEQSSVTKVVLHPGVAQVH